MKTNKQIAVFGTDNKIKKWRKMTRNDVERYFNSLPTVKINKKIITRQVGEYCDRCGVNIGQHFENKEPKWLKTFSLCGRCYEYKTTPNGESTPDLEDLKRI